MVDRSEGATTLLGMPEFVVGAQIEVGGEWWLAVETAAVVIGCEVCGTRAVGHGRRRVKVRDLPMADRPVVLVWAKRLTARVQAESDPRKPHDGRTTDEIAK